MWKSITIRINNCALVAPMGNHSHASTWLPTAYPAGNKTQPDHYSLLVVHQLHGCVLLVYSEFCPGEDNKVGAAVWDPTHYRIPSTGLSVCWARGRFWLRSKPSPGPSRSVKITGTGSVCGWSHDVYMKLTSEMIVSPRPQQTMLVRAHFNHSGTRSATLIMNPDLSPLCY
jgi:hypothetical protein